MLSCLRISLPKRLITTSITACLQASESLHNNTKHFCKVTSFSSTKSTSMSPNTSPIFKFSDKTFLWILSTPIHVTCPTHPTLLITLIIFYNNKNYDSPPVNFHVLMSVYPSAVQMISSVFSSQTPATNINYLYCCTVHFVVI